MTRGRNPTAEAAELASAVLSDLAADPAPSRAAIAARHGISRQRVQAIARAAGLPSGGRGGGAQPSHHESAALLARLRELAAAAGEEPGDYLEDAARCRAACEQIVADVLDDPVCGEDPKLALFMIRRLAIGHKGFV